MSKRIRVAHLSDKRRFAKCETCYATGVKTVTVRDLRQKWPETERALLKEHEILVTRDSKPVAKLVLYIPPEKPRKRFDAASHGKWQRKISGGKITRWVDEGLLKERDER